MSLHFLERLLPSPCMLVRFYVKLAGLTHVGRGSPEKGFLNHLMVNVKMEDRWPEQSGGWLTVFAPSPSAAPPPTSFPLRVAVQLWFLPPLSIFICTGFVHHSTAFNGVVHHSTASSMASSVSFPNRPPSLAPRPAVRVPQNTCESRSSVSATMNLDRHTYPHDFDFTTASVAIARERAGSRTRPARYSPPSEHPYHTDNRQDPSVFKHHDQACHYPVSLTHVFCFLIITFARLLL